MHKFKPPLPVVSDYDIRVLVASGNIVMGLGLDEVTARMQLGPGGTIRRVLEFEWLGPQSATLLGRNMQGSVIFFDMGPARTKGQKVIGSIGDWNFDERAPRMRMRRTGRPLSWWAERVALLKRGTSNQVVKQERKEP
jgi:hypothetical protein